MRCVGKTAKNLRCKRNATLGSRCLQHAPVMEPPPLDSFEEVFDLADLIKQEDHKALDPYRLALALYRKGVRLEKKP